METMFISAVQTTGRVGLPAPIKELAAQRWDAIIVGAGHNGLTCAAYLARGGKRVLVLESRERIGGACTIEEPWPGVRMSPCAYLAGLLHPLVVEELDLPALGFSWTPAVNGLFIPFEDGSSVQLYENDEQCQAEIRRLCPADVAGWEAMCSLIRRTRDKLRPANEHDAWIGEPPTREQIETRLGKDEDAKRLLFEWSMAEMVEHYLSDERLQAGYLGQGVIGTNASPFDRGTASIRFHHSSGRLGGMPGMWGYVKGGMGMVSFYIADAAAKAGAVIASGVPVAHIIPGDGVQLESGETIYAPVVISNADPRTALRLLGDNADPTWRGKVAGVPMRGCTLKVNVWLKELPDFRARPGTLERHHYGQINTPLSKQEWKDGYAAARKGTLPGRLWTELYFQSVHDASIVPAGTHTMSVFAQYVPYQFVDGDWNQHREAAKRIALDALARYCSNMPEVVIDCEALGPADIEERVGLTGGHIFQGECLPDYMWSNRLSCRTPMPGFYLCGAATHPGGSVIAINGRNAAMAVMADSRRAGAVSAAD
jgi:phytoene dehydrogenase-like protein